MSYPPSYPQFIHNLTFYRTYCLISFGNFLRYRTFYMDKITEYGKNRDGY